MTIYLPPGAFDDPTPSLGQSLGQSTGSLVGTGLSMLIKHKMQNMKATAEHQKNYGELPSAISKLAKDTKRDETYRTEDYNAIHEIAKNFVNQGYDKNIAAQKAILEYEKEKEPQTGLDYLKKGAKQQGAIHHTQARFSDLFKPKETAGYTTPETKARFMDIFKPKESAALAKRTSEKARSGAPLSEFTIGEMLTLTNEDLQHLSKEDQAAFKESLPFWQKKMAGIATSAAIPGIGGAVEERAREQVDPDLAPPPGIADVSRIATELPYLGALLGGATVGKQAVRGAATFGGGEGLNEVIRTLGTDKPADLKTVGIQTALGAALPYGAKYIKSLSRLLRNAIAKRMKISGKNGLEVAESILQDAQKEGISLAELQKGSEAEGKKFSNYLEGEAQKTQLKVKERVAPIKTTGKKKETVKKPSNLAVKEEERFEKEYKEKAAPVKTKSKKKETLRDRAETSKEAEKRFARESKVLSQTPIDEYLEPRKETKRMVERKALLGPKLQQISRRIKDFEKELLNKTGADLRNIQEELAAMKRRKYELTHEIKYGKPPPTAQELTAQAEKSSANLVKMIMNPDEGTLKAIQKNDKMMNTFLTRAKDEIVRGKLPAKFIKDTFLGIQEAHLKAYKALRKDIKNHMLIPHSNIRVSGMGQTLIDQLDHRINGIEAAIKVQSQKRAVKQAVKGPMGKFYRDWVDKLKGEQKLFSKDMIRINDQIRKAEKDITPIAKERMKQFGGIPTKEAAEKAGAKAVSKGKDAVVKAAQQAGATKAESKRIGEILKEMKNPPKFDSFEAYRKWMKKKMRALLGPVKSQLVMGVALGAVDSISKEIAGTKVPFVYKSSIYGGIGFTSLTGRTRPILAAIGALTDWFLTSKRVSHYKKKMKSKSVVERRKEYERIKEKKGFSAKQLKEIREG